MSITLEEIIKEYYIRLFVYFGSYKTDDYIDGRSDIDIAFLSDRHLIPEEKNNLLKDLIIYHKKSEIDLVDLEKANGLLRFEIISNGKLLYEKFQGLYLQYQLYCARYYYDTAHFRKQRNQDLFKDIRERFI